jgi:hypothetical protein
LKTASSPYVGIMAAVATPKITPGDTARQDGRERRRQNGFNSLGAYKNLTLAQLCFHESASAELGAVMASKLDRSMTRQRVS